MLKSTKMHVDAIRGGGISLSSVISRFQRDFHHTREASSAQLLNSPEIASVIASVAASQLIPGMDTARRPAISPRPAIALNCFRLIRL